MIILGLDPGLGRTGFGVIDTDAEPRFVRCGCLTTPASTSEPDRLARLVNDLTQIIQQIHPDLAIVEEIFFGKNHKTAIMTAQARGALVAELRRHHIPVQSITPLQIKSRLTGYGAASKEQVQSVVTQQLHLSIPPQPDDAADALAAALCAF